MHGLNLDDVRLAHVLLRIHDDVIAFLKDEIAVLKKPSSKECRMLHSRLATMAGMPRKSYPRLMQSPSVPTSMISNVRFTA